MENNEKNSVPNPQNNYNGYAPKEKKNFSVLLIILLAGIPVILLIIALLIVLFLMMGKNSKNLKSKENAKDEIIQIVKATSDLHQEINPIEVATDIDKSFSEALDDAAKEAEEQAKEMFNMRFNVYEGQQRGGAVKALITSVTSANSNGKRRIKIDGIKDITSIDSKNKYNVKMNYDSEGYINEIIITETE